MFMHMGPGRLASPLPTHHAPLIMSLALRCVMLPPLGPVHVQLEVPHYRLQVRPWGRAAVRCLSGGQLPKVRSAGCRSAGHGGRGLPWGPCLGALLGRLPIRAEVE